jgi:hypothetical protein
MIFVSDKHSLVDEDHENQVADACKLSHEDHHVEMHSGHLVDEYARIWIRQW